MKEEVETKKDKDGKDVEVKKIVLDRVLYQMPAGTDIKEETLVELEEVEDGWMQELKKDVYTFTLTTKNLKGEVKETVVNVPRGELIEIVRATEIPDNYGTFDGSGLEVTVNKVPIGTTDRAQYYEGYQFKLK